MTRGSVPELTDVWALERQTRRVTDAAPWRNTTHDWRAAVDVPHLEQIRSQPSVYAPGGALHLLLEVLAYCADEAESSGHGTALVTLHQDGSVSVADDGRGTDTRYDAHGRPVKKPVMATPDLRFAEHADLPLLPDGHPRRGMSVVAALSSWLVHTNRRRNGSWTQRYENGSPTTDLTPVPDDWSTGTTVDFMPAITEAPPRPFDVDALTAALSHLPSWLTVSVADER